jgi:hypothetical protein
MLNFIFWYASEKVGKSLHKALNLKAPPPSLQLRKATAYTSTACTVCPSSVIILFIVVCIILYLLFSFIWFFSQISNLVPSFYTLYLFIPCSLTYPYTFPSSYLFLLLTFSPSSIFLLLTHFALLWLLSIIFSFLFFFCWLFVLWYFLSFLLSLSSCTHPSNVFFVLYCCVIDRF